MSSISKKAIHLFDCDGVILDSNKLKIKALQFSLESAGCPNEFVDWATNHFRENFGITRSQHFKFFERNDSFTNFTFTPEMSTAVMSLYGKNVKSLYLECEIIEETHKYLLGLPSDQPIFVVSASDQMELKSILPIRIPRLNSANIFGGPTKKEVNVKAILDIHGSEGAVLYGDSVKDGLAAETNNIQFCGLTKYSADPESLISYCKKRKSDLFEHCLQVSL